LAAEGQSWGRIRASFAAKPRVSLGVCTRDRWLLGLTALGLALRLAYLPSHAPVRGDQFFYLTFAHDFGAWWTNSIGPLPIGQPLRVPGYVFFVTIFDHLGGVGGVRVAQVLLLSLACFLVAVAVARASSLRFGRATAALGAIYPPFIMLPSVVLPDALSASLVAAGFFLLLEARWSGKRLQLLAAMSAVVTFAVLVRPNNIFVVPVFAIGAVVVGASLGARRLVAAVVLPAVLLFAPWIGRNYHVYDRAQPLGDSKTRQIMAAAVSMPAYRATGRLGAFNRSNFLYDRHATPGAPLDIYKAARVDPWAVLGQNLRHRPLQQLGLSAFWIKELLVVPFDDHASYGTPSEIPWGINQVFQLFFLILALIGVWIGRNLFAIQLAIASALALVIPFAIFLPEPRYASGALMLLLAPAGVALGWGAGTTMVPRQQ
jgi:hypothetical protein